jgi:hypothetical protein
MEVYEQPEDGAKLNKSLLKLYAILFFVSLATIILSIISSEHKAFFFMNMRPAVHGSAVVEECLRTANCNL